MNPCPKCGAHALWDDNMWYGCNACGGMWNVSNPHPNSPSLKIVRQPSYSDDGQYNRRGYNDYNEDYNESYDYRRFHGYDDDDED